MKRVHAYKINLTKIDGNGDFACPRCGTKISPDDETEDIYSILEPKVNSHGLEEVVIRCNTCSSQIHLTGFSILQKMPDISSRGTRETSKSGESLLYCSRAKLCRDDTTMTHD